MYSSPLSPQTPDNHWSFYCLHCFAFSRMAYSWNLFFCFPWREGFKAFMPIRPLMAHPHVDRTGSRWQTPPLNKNTAAFLPVLSPVPLVLPSSHMEVQGDTCWVFVHRKATSFVPLVTMNPDSCRVCCKQTSHFFRPPALSTPQQMKVLNSKLNLQLYGKHHSKIKASQNKYLN